jgi:hypothetical protein
MDMPMAWLPLAACLLLGAIPPLTHQQRVRLETARDGRDHREEAFLALVENVREWSVQTGGAPFRLDPDLDAMIAEPARSRGDLCRLEGVVQQKSMLGRPHDRVGRWYIRDDRGRPILLYVVHPPGDAPADPPEGSRIAVMARFYKPVELTARDGVTRPYPAFVGPVPKLLRRAGATAPLAALPVVLFLVIPLLAAFAMLLIYTRRQRRAVAVHGPVLPAIDPEPDDDRPLPDDPAEALAELRRRADGGDHLHSSP